MQGQPHLIAEIGAEEGAVETGVAAVGAVVVVGVAILAGKLRWLDLQVTDQEVQVLKKNFRESVSGAVGWGTESRSVGR